MTKQQKIREGIAKWLYESRGGTRWEVMTKDEREVWCIHTDGLLRYEDSQGVVIRGDEHPRYPGYVAVELLIQESKAVFLPLGPDEIIDKGL
ncbi:hypothetical protein LCGC14_2620810 [marine sediment metagenome]|uniref:Uncharacterized protein n=1 Tax=marine sediment metagenome TaxID=412755 RepID=A0A0F9CVP2_9ZZZZ